VFPAFEGTRMITTVPGNHDIGLGDGISLPRLNRFKDYFTDENTTSQIFETCGFQLILLDTPSLLNTQTPEIHDPPAQFLDTIPDPRPDLPRILFTHIPLYRPADTPCGAYRESPRPIFYGAGYQYQNTLPPALSTRILDALWPVSAVFTGDDHDYCVVEHEMEGRRESVPEYTVKSFSMAMVPAPPIPPSPGRWY
jgi:ethanolamine phosphate phosphodiesterase